jgi:adenosylcobyric acid synthase
MGQTSSACANQPFLIEQRSNQPCRYLDGTLSEDGNILGTYIHGLFHNDDLRRAILSELAARRGKQLPQAASPFSLDDQYDRLADHVRKSLNMDLIIRLLDGR